MVQLYGLSDIGCEQNRQFQAVILVYVSQVKYAYTWWTNQIWRPSVLVFKAIMQTQDMTASGMICCPCPLRNTLKHSKLIWYIHSCIFVVYSDGAESGRKQVKHSRVDPTQAYERSCTWSGIENGSEGCAADTTVTICGNIWGIGASWIKTRIFRSMYSLSKTI